MNILTLGLNHHTAPQDLRGRFAFTMSDLLPRLQGLGGAAATGHHPEVAWLSTCNRSELYCASHADGRELGVAALDWLAAVGGVTRRQLRNHAYLLQGDAAVRHAFRVASGLDSMVLGETQILGQMKRAMHGAQSAGTLGRNLHQLFQRSFAVAKQVRSGTGLGQHSVSLAAIAARLVRDANAHRSAPRVLLLGAGEMIGQVAAHLGGLGPGSLSVANRSVERAAALAQRLGADWLGLDEIAKRLCEFDAVVSCTAAEHVLLDQAMVAAAMQARADRALVIVDLALPRDVDPAVAQLPGVQLHALDDLAREAASGVEHRRAAVELAQGMVDAAVSDFMRWTEQRAAVPLIQALNAQVEQWREQPLRRAQRALARGEPPERVLMAMSDALARKMLHGALAELHESSGPQRVALSGTLHRLFLRCPVRYHGLARPAADPGPLSHVLPPGPPARIYAWPAQVAVAGPAPALRRRERQGPL